MTKSLPRLCQKSPGRKNYPLLIATDSEFLLLKMASNGTIIRIGWRWGRRCPGNRISGDPLSHPPEWDYCIFRRPSLPPSNLLTFCALGASLTCLYFWPCGISLHFNKNKPDFTKIGSCSRMLLRILLFMQYNVVCLWETPVYICPKNRHVFSKPLVCFYLMNIMNCIIFCLLFCF